MATIDIFDNLYLEIEEESADNVEYVHQGESQEQAPPLKSKKKTGQWAVIKIMVGLLVTKYGNFVQEEI